LLKVTADLPNWFVLLCLTLCAPLQVMEQQTVSVAKTRITTTLNTPISVTGFF
jgi:hypothetical protein